MRTCSFLTEVVRCPSPLRYEERLKYIQNITSNQLQSTFEDFCENVMHPMEMSSTVPVSKDYISNLQGCSTSESSLTSVLRSIALTSTAPTVPQQQQQQQTLAIPATAFLKLDHSPARRQRSNTNDDRMARSAEHRDHCKLVTPPCHLLCDIGLFLSIAAMFLRSSVPGSLNNLSSSGRFSPSPTGGLVYRVPPPSPQ